MDDPSMQYRGGVTYSTFMEMAPEEVVFIPLFIPWGIGGGARSCARLRVTDAGLAPLPPQDVWSWRVGAPTLRWRYNR